MTVEEFARIDEPGRFDLIDGEVWSLPPAEMMHSHAGVPLLAALATHVHNRRLGRVFSLEVGFRLSLSEQTVLCPDIAFVRAGRMVAPDTRGFFPGPPDLAVEVISRSESAAEVQEKVTRYLKAGTQLVWCVYPHTKQVVVYAPEGPPRILGPADTLDGGEFLPEFRLPLAELFSP
jgi:Uma2 family endonuclease